MITKTSNQVTRTRGTTLTWKVYPSSDSGKTDPNVQSLLRELSPNKSWGERKIAAKKLGYLGNPDAVPGLIAVLQEDHFWMVRCAIIQALELIGDHRSIPALREAAQKDGFQIVRSYASIALERLS